VREISDKEINVMDAPGAGTAPRYPTPKVFVASIPGVEVGSVIDYTYKITHADKPFFADLWTARTMTPARRRTLTIDRPVDLALELVGDSSRPAWTFASETAGRREQSSWTARDVPGMTREDMMPPLWSFVPTVMASTGSLDDYAQEVHKTLTGAARDAAKTAAQGRQLVKGKTSDFDRIEAIRDWVAINIRSAGPGITGMPLSFVTPADKTLADRYGNTSDRAVVLHAMLAAVGYEPRFVLASSLPRVEEMTRRRMGAEDYRPFDAVLVAVQAKHAGETMTVYLNDTDQYDALGTTPHTGRLALNLPEAETFEIAPPDVLHDRTQVHYDLHVKADGDVTITRTRRYFGQAFGRMNRRFEEMTPELRRRYHQEAVAEVSQAARAEGDLTTDFSTYPGTETMTVAVEGYGIRDGQYLYLNLPASLEDLLWLRSDTREHPLYLSSPQEVSVGVGLRVPREFRLAMKPTTLDWTGPGGQVELSFQPMRTPGAYGWSAVAKLEAALISPEQYARLFELQRRLSHRAARLILLRHRDGAKGTARVGE
jgi:transglutaminase-like putative cysteine protease